MSIAIRSIVAIRALSAVVNGDPDIDAPTSTPLSVRKPIVIAD
jgi:hypothetical protein